MRAMAEGLHAEAEDTSCDPRAPHPTPLEPSVSGVRFVEPDERAAVCKELVAQGAIVARVDAIAVTSRSRLADLVQSAVDRALGTASPNSSGHLEITLAAAAAATRGIVL